MSLIASTWRRSSRTGNPFRYPASRRRATTTTAPSRGCCLTVMPRRAPTTAITPTTSTGKPVCSVSSRDARRASWRLLRTYGTRCPLTMKVSPPTQTEALGWCLAFTVNTPAGPTSTWSMSASAAPLGRHAGLSTAVRGLRARRHRFRVAGARTPTSTLRRQVLVDRRLQERQVRQVVGMEPARRQVEVAQGRPARCLRIQPLVPVARPPPHDPARHLASPTDKAGPSTPPCAADRHTAPTPEALDAPHLPAESVQYVRAWVMAGDSMSARRRRANEHEADAHHCAALRDQDDGGCRHRSVPERVTVKLLQ